MTLHPNGRTSILFLVDRLDERSAGAERFVVGLAIALHGETFEVAVCTTRGASGPLLEQLTRNGIRHTDIGRRTRFDFYRLWRLVYLLRRRRVTILHAHKFGSNLWGAIAGRLAGTAVVIAQEHTWSYNGKRWRRLLDGQVIGRFVTRFAAVSQRDADRMIQIEHVMPRKVCVVPTSYIPRTWASGRQSRFRELLRLGNDSPVVGIAGRLTPQKAIHEAIDAHAHVLSAFPNAHLLIAGDGECRSALADQVRRKGLEQSVHFLGFLEDIDSFIRAVDIGVSASIYEGMPLWLLECMANGCPVVATNVGAVSDIVTHELTGLLTPAGDARGLADGVIRLINNPKLRRQYALAGQRRVLEEFTIERAAERWSNLYSECLSEHPSTSSSPKAPMT